jgi:hypothetical protein
MGMKKKKRITLPRLMWHRSPVTRIKVSGKIYSRKKTRKLDNEG